MSRKKHITDPIKIAEEIRSWGGEEVSAMELYSHMFHLGEGLIQLKDELPADLDSDDIKTNPIALYKYPHTRADGTETHCWRRRILFEDTFEATLKELQEKDTAVIGGLSYFGKRNLLANANKLYAFIYDLDGQSVTTMRNFLSGAINGGAYPIPNYIALSGHGAHLYYLMEYPIPLFPDVKKRVNDLKKQLTKQIWNGLTTLEDTIQTQGINQGFRVVGGKTKIEGLRVRAFKISDVPHNLKGLSEWVEEQYKIDDDNLFDLWAKDKKKKKTFEEAIKLWPDWYEEKVKPYEESKKKSKIKKKRVVENKGWQVKGDYLYNWWLEQIKRGATFRHRHNCVRVLAIMAIKSRPEDVPFERLKKDAYDLIPMLNALQPDEPFTEEDVEHALMSYDPKYRLFSKSAIEDETDIKIPEGPKRQYRKQAQHLILARRRKADLKEIGEPFKNPEGRPSKEDEIRQYIKKNPDKNVTQIARELGVSRPTVYKYKE